jgi:hypothetical protein
MTITDLALPSAAYDAVLNADKPSPDAGGPCATCAFRLNTEAACSQHTSTLAKLCVEGITPFHCHEAPTLCRGWIAAVNLNGVPETEDERRWMECARAAAEILATCIASAVEYQDAMGAATP